MAQSTRFTMIGLALVLIVIAAATGVLLVAVKRSIRQSKIDECASNLKSLWTAQLNYALQYGRPSGPKPVHVGGDFWLKLQESRGIDRSDVFHCPLAGGHAEKGRTSYRGPARNVNKFEDLDVIAADKEGNHGPGAGGNVLTKLGDIREVAETDPLWLRARETTRE